MISSKKTAAALLALTLALAGCGSSPDSNGGAASADSGNGPQSASNGQAQNGPGDWQGGPMMESGLFGKVKSVNGNTITLYKSSFQPGARGGGQGRDGNPPGGSRDRGQSREVPNQDGEPPFTEPPASGDGSAGPQGENRQRPDMGDMFSEETVDINVTADTKIVKISFANEERVETALTITDLQADDIVSVDLEEGSQNAITITLNDGGFGGMGMGMDGGRRGQPQDAQQ
ncbi:hypothetical protein [Cohnella cellulosilytica]|uniref:DUF5666 domain-containing protein n=1 Tax=Cohnella cellulosilytica TaxID=986710 RepID=A0ABW2FHW8_9BACL